MTEEAGTGAERGLDYRAGVGRSGRAWLGAAGEGEKADVGDTGVSSQAGWGTETLQTAPQHTGQ